MTQKELLLSYSKVADIHAQRLSKALKKLHPILPLTTDSLSLIDDINLGFLEMLTNRFAKLQDTIGAKIFPLMLELMQEDIADKSFLDRLHLLEKLGLLENTLDWIKMREIRNHVTHEYPDDPKRMTHNINQAIQEAHKLLIYWTTLKSKVTNLLSMPSP